MMLHLQSHHPIAALFPQAIDQSAKLREIPDDDFMLILSREGILFELFQSKAVQEKLGKRNDFENLPLAEQRHQLAKAALFPALAEPFGRFNAICKDLESDEVQSIVSWIREQRAFEPPRNLYFTARSVQRVPILDGILSRNNLTSASSLLQSAFFKEHLTELAALGVNSLDSLSRIVALLDPQEKKQFADSTSIFLMKRLHSGFLMHHAPIRSIELIEGALSVLPWEDERANVPLNVLAERVDAFCQSAASTMRAARVFAPSLNVATADDLRELRAVKTPYRERKDLLPLYRTILRNPSESWRIETVADFTRVMIGLEAISAILQHGNPRVRASVSLLDQWARSFGQTMGEIGPHDWQAIETFPLQLSRIVNHPKFLSFIASVPPEEKDRSPSQITRAFIRRQVIEGHITAEQLEALTPAASSEVLWARVVAEMRRAKMDRLLDHELHREPPNEYTDFYSIAMPKSISLAVLDRAFSHPRKLEIYNHLVNDWRYPNMYFYQFAKIMTNAASLEYYGDPKNCRRFEEFEKLLFSDKHASDAGRQEAFEESLPRNLAPFLPELVQRMKAPNSTLRNELLEYLPNSADSGMLEREELENFTKALRLTKDVDTFLQEAGLLKERFRLQPGSIVRAISRIETGARRESYLRNVHKSSEFRDIVSAVKPDDEFDARADVFDTFVARTEQELRSAHFLIQLAARNGIEFSTEGVFDLSVFSSELTADGILKLSNLPLPEIVNEMKEPKSMSSFFSALKSRY